jgi:hypothetical protein
MTAWVELIGVLVMGVGMSSFGMVTDRITRTRPIRTWTGRLLATPPDLGRPLPPEYPSLTDLAAQGWLPILRRPLPFTSIVAASASDALGDPVRVRTLADAWGSRWHDLGASATSTRLPATATGRTPTRSSKRSAPRNPDPQAVAKGGEA